VRSNVNVAHGQSGVQRHVNRLVPLRHAVTKLEVRLPVNAIAKVLCRSASDFDVVETSFVAIFIIAFQHEVNRARLTARVSLLYRIDVADVVPRGSIVDRVGERLLTILGRSGCPDMMCWKRRRKPLPASPLDVVLDEARVLQRTINGQCTVGITPADTLLRLEHEAVSWVGIFDKLGRGGSGLAVFTAPRVQSVFEVVGKQGSCFGRKSCLAIFIEICELAEGLRPSSADYGLAAFEEFLHSPGTCLCRACLWQRARLQETAVSVAAHTTELSDLLRFDREVALPVAMGTQWRRWGGRRRWC